MACIIFEYMFFISICMFTRMQLVRRVHINSRSRSEWSQCEMCKYTKLYLGRGGGGMRTQCV